MFWVASVPYAGAGSLAMLPCQQYNQHYIVNVGVDRDLLGSLVTPALPKDGLDVYKSAKTTLIQAIKGCEPKK